MSRTPVAALALALAALGFGLGYYTALSREQPRQAPAPAPRRDALPTPQGISAAVQEALANPDRLERTSQLARLLQGLGPESIGDVTDAYDAAFLEVGDVSIVLLAEWWARFDPAGALAWVRSTRTRNTPAVITAVFRAWAERDPEEAAREVKEIANPELRRSSVDALVRGWNDSGKPGLEDFLLGLPHGIDQQRAISVLARQKVHREGVEETFRWAEALPNDAARFKLNVFRRVGSWAAEVDPQRAAVWAKQHGEEECGQGLYRRVGTRWAQEDGAAAMAWLTTLPAGVERDTGVQETYRVWLTRDNAAAMSWLRGVELEPWLEPALVLYVQSLARESPEQALEWTSLIRDAERRREATIKIGRYWHQVDAEAAQAWLDRSGLPDEDRKWILEPPRARRGRGAGPGQEDVPWQEDVPLREEE